ncbi:hypothetical protein ES319_D13G127100v1 [Gossypium barbadense]|uniref:Uncharacterized protein n=2 Tax=Gossypium TaxID=3633 RepID=A0A5J5NKL8_GOSBA|nr:hypothetical protein ES319_D13G127100v1 [Gossypium barbadense]TYG37351.1 hypothetical protein ES288_D13G134800v1 [Gossypium darwinii]
MDEGREWWLPGYKRRLNSYGETIQLAAYKLLLDLFF